MAERFFSRPQPSLDAIYYSFHFAPEVKRSCPKHLLSQFGQLRKLLENSKTIEAALRDELDALREENLHLSLAGDCGDDDSNTDDVRNSAGVGVD